MLSICLQRLRDTDQFPVTGFLMQANEFQAIPQAFQFVMYMPTLPSNGQGKA